MRLVKKVYDFLTGRWYALDVSGHGSGFIRDKDLRTKKVALKEARHWESIADTIGGMSQVSNVINGKVIYLYGREFN